jgi:hypothetical protein
MTVAAALIVAATMTGTGPARADDQVSLVFENTLEQNILLEVYDNYIMNPGLRQINLSRATIDGKPSGLGYKVGFKTSKNKEGRILFKVTSHCGTSSDAFFYTQVPSGGTIKVTAGCKLTRP